VKKCGNLPLGQFPTFYPHGLSLHPPLQASIAASIVTTHILGGTS
jgi:hypothetical protein